MFGSASAPSTPSSSGHAARALHNGGVRAVPPPIMAEDTVQDTLPAVERNRSRPTVWRASTWPARELKDIACKFDDDAETACGSEQSSMERFPTTSTYLEYLDGVGVITAATPRLNISSEQLESLRLCKAFSEHTCIDASLPSPAHFCTTGCGASPAGFRMSCFDPKMWLAVGFSFVNGWIDAISLQRYQAFATMMVGNMLLLGSSLAEEMMRTGKPEDPAKTHLGAAGGPFFYMSIILAFVTGVTVYRILEKKRGWSARTVAPVVVLWIVLHEVLEGFMERSSYRTPSRWNILRLAPIFGAQDAVTVKGGLATLPWCTTGHVVTIGHVLADTLTGGATAEERRKCAVALSMMASMILGAVSGMAFDKKFNTVEWEYSVAAPVLAAFFLIHDRMFRSPAVKPPSEEELPSEDTPSCVYIEDPKDSVVATPGHSNFDPKALDDMEDDDEDSREDSHACKEGRAAGEEAASAL